MHRLTFVLLIVPFALSVGCSQAPKGAAPAAPVKGTIKMDGNPLPTGELHFGIAGYPPRVLQVTNGAFAGEAPIGENQVELIIYTEVPASDKYKVPTKQNTAPEKYWGPNTALSAKVTAGQANEFKFDVTSK